MIGTLISFDSQTYVDQLIIPIYSTKTKTENRKHSNESEAHIFAERNRKIKQKRCKHTRLAFLSHTQNMRKSSFKSSFRVAIFFAIVVVIFIDRFGSHSVWSVVDKAHDSEISKASNQQPSQINFCIIIFLSFNMGGGGGGVVFAVFFLSPFSCLYFFSDRWPTSFVYFSYVHQRHCYFRHCLLL